MSGWIADNTAAVQRSAAATLAPAAVAAAAAGACVLTVIVDPNQPGNYPTCPFLALTGRWCPGCGSLRGVNALMRGNIALAADLNILMVLAVPFLLYAWGAWAVRTWTSRVAPPLRLSGGATWGLLAVVLVFWVARNLPWAPLEILAP